MDFNLSDDLLAIDEGIRQLCDRFDSQYWREHDRSEMFPFEFRDAVAKAGWFGLTMPEEFGGAGLGITEAAVMMHAIANSGGAMSACSTVHMNIFGPQAIVVFGGREQHQRWLPDLVSGKTIACFAVTEPNVGLDTTNIRTRADRRGDHYLVQGQKIWTSTAQVANKIMLLARTTPQAETSRSVDGLSLFYTDLDRSRIDIRVIDKMGRAAVDTNEVFFDGLPVPVEDRIGEEGKGFHYLLHSLNPERILVAAEAVGIGRCAVSLATEYAKERIVFGRPIGQNQAIQHPLAQSWMELEAAWLTCLRAAWSYDQGLDAGPPANTAKYLAAEAAFKACERAVMAHGGMGYAKEFQVERLLREVWITRIAPVTPELIQCYIAERVLGLPKSY